MRHKTRYLKNAVALLTSCPLKCSSLVRYRPLKRVPPTTRTRFLLAAMFMSPRRALIRVGDSAKLDTLVGPKAPPRKSINAANLDIVLSQSVSQIGRREFAQPIGQAAQLATRRTSPYVDKGDRGHLENASSSC